MFAHLKQAAAAFVIWENVEDVMGEATSDGELLVEAFGGAGYVMATRLLDSSKYGYPQGRCRIYGVAMHIEKSGLPEPKDALALVETIMDQVVGFAIDGHIPLKNFILPADHPIVKDMLSTLRTPSGTRGHPPAAHSGLSSTASLRSRTIFA